MHGLSQTAGQASKRSRTARSQAVCIWLKLIALWWRDQVARWRGGVGIVGLVEGVWRGLLWVRSERGCGRPAVELRKILGILSKDIVGCLVAEGTAVTGTGLVGEETSEDLHGEVGNY